MRIHGNLLGLLGGLLLIAAQVPDADAQTPFLEYRFEEGAGPTAVNSGSIAAADGELAGAVHSSDVPPGTNSLFSMSFDGSSSVILPADFQYTEDGSAGGVPLTQLTIEAWVKPTATNGQRVVWDDYGNPGTVITVFDGKAQWNISTDDQPAGGVGMLVGNIVPNVWTHIAGVYDGAEIRVYIDGQHACGSRTASGGLQNNSSTVATIGSDNGTPALYFEGFIDDVRVFPVALSREELAGGFFAADEELPCFRRIDGNGDGTLNLADPVYALNHLFLSGPATCDDALDANDDGTLNLVDPLHMLDYLFSGGPTPGAPFVACGFDPTPDTLDCDERQSCE